MRDIIKSIFKKLLINTTNTLPILNNGPYILAFHGVTDNKNPVLNKNLHLDVDLFIEIINFLNKNFDISDIDELTKSDFSFKKNKLYLTFDDGYKNNLENVAPILKNLSLPWTMFISPYHIDNKKKLPTFYSNLASKYLQKKKYNFNSLESSIDFSNKNINKYLKKILNYNSLSKSREFLNELISLMKQQDVYKEKDKYLDDNLLNWEEINFLVDSYNLTIGSHSYYHIPLSQDKSEEFIFSELNKSKISINKNKISTKLFAYPNGGTKDVSKLAFKALKKENFDIAFTMWQKNYKKNQPKYLIPRISISSIKDFKYNNYKFLIDKSYNLFG